MARAGMVEYQFRPQCLLCSGKTGETLKFHSRNSDLGDGDVAIPIHRSCYLKKLAGLLLKGALIALGIGLLLTYLEVSIMNYNTPPLQAFFHAPRIPVWLGWLNLIFMLIAVLISYLRDRFKFREFIEHRIRLDTLPIN